MRKPSGKFVGRVFGAVLSLFAAGCDNSSTKVASSGPADVRVMAASPKRVVYALWDLDQINGADGAECEAVDGNKRYYFHGNYFNWTDHLYVRIDGPGRDTLEIFDYGLNGLNSQDREIRSRRYTDTIVMNGDEFTYGYLPESEQARVSKMYARALNIGLPKILEEIDLRKKEIETEEKERWSAQAHEKNNKRTTSP